jgi:hypothetical protein
VPHTAEEVPHTAEEVPHTAEEVPHTAEEVPHTAEEVPHTAEAAPPIAEKSAPVAEQAPPAAEVTPPAVEKKTVEQTAGEVAAEVGSEVAHGPGEDSQVPADASGLTHKDAAGEVSPGVLIAVTTATAPAAASEISTSPAQDQPSLTVWPRTISPRRAGQVSCELAAIGASITAGYAGGWLDISAASSVSIVPFATVGPSPTAMTSGAPGGSQDDGSAVENHPSAPTPGPGPGGAGSGSAAGGGSGSASSASFALVSVRLQAAPRAMRLLRLAQPSWRTSFFVLIPERPD